jgi:hypothetical protein
MNRVFARLFVILFLSESAVSYACANRDRILSVDIGSTRVKAALLSEDMSIEDLQKTPIITFPSENWLGPDITHFLDPHCDTSLATKFFAESYSSISLLLSCDIWQNKINLSRSNMPKDIEACLGQYSNKTLFIENDMVGFSRGTLYFQKLFENPIRYPCLCISLGTGAAASVCESENDFTIVMLNKVNQDFHRLRSVVSKQTNREPGSGSLMGRVFFQWIKETRPDCTEQEVQTMFQERFNAFLQDFLDFLREKGFFIQTVLVGGGNSRYLSAEKVVIESSVDLSVMNPFYFDQLNISPDLLSLLNAIPLRQRSFPKTAWIPKLEEVYSIDPLDTAFDR